MASADGFRSIEKPLDDFKHTCQPCLHLGLMQEADTFCIQCEEYMCESCATIHKVFKLSINHKMVSRSDLPSWKKLTLEYCDDPTDKTINSLADMTVESSRKINVPSDCITGSAVMADGRIILVDQSNNKIFLLDVKFNIKSALKLPSHPWDVAVDGANDVVVSVPGRKQLRYIHVDTGLEASRTIKTRGPCWGVAVYKDEVYVGVCTGGGWLYTAGVGRVDVMDRRGNVIRRIGETPSGTHMFTQPDYITVNARGSVFVTDWYTRHITCLTNGGDVVYHVQHKEICGPCGIVADDDDNLIVCCEWSHDIHVLGKDGTQHKVILSSADGVKSPRSVSYRRVDNTLVITMVNTPCCRAYKLK